MSQTYASGGDRCALVHPLPPPFKRQRTQAFQMNFGSPFSTNIIPPITQAPTTSHERQQNEREFVTNNSKDESHQKIPQQTSLVGSAKIFAQSDLNLQDYCVAQNYDLLCAKCFNQQSKSFKLEGKVLSIKHEINNENTDLDAQDAQLESNHESVMVFDFEEGGELYQPRFALLSWRAEFFVWNKLFQSSAEGVAVALPVEFELQIVRKNSDNDSNQHEIVFRRAFRRTCLSGAHGNTIYDTAWIPCPQHGDGVRLVNKSNFGEQEHNHPIPPDVKSTIISENSENLLEVNESEFLCEDLPQSIEYNPNHSDYGDSTVWFDAEAKGAACTEVTPHIEFFCHVII